MDFESISNFIDVVAHPEKYKQAIAELKAHHAKIQAAIGVNTSIAEVNSKLKEAKANYELSKQKVASAEIEADKLVADTKAALIAEVKLLEDKATSLVAREQALVEKQLTHAEEVAKHNALAEELSAKEAHLVTWHAKLADEQQEIADRLSKLRDVMA